LSRNDIILFMRANFDIDLTERYYDY